MGYLKDNIFYLSTSAKYLHISLFRNIISPHNHKIHFLRANAIVKLISGRTENK